MDLVLIIIELILVDLILGGDNAIVISMATKDLPKEIQLKASIYGAIVAICLRIVFIILVIYFGEKHIMFLNLIAGLLLIKVAIDMLKPQNEQEHQVQNSNNLMGAIKTIVIADAVMSFDNAIVIASVAEKANVSSVVEIALIVLALLFSFPVILFGAQILSKVIERFKVIIYVFGLLLIHIGVELLSKDHVFTKINLELPGGVEASLIWLVAIIIFIATLFINQNKTSNS